MLSHFLIVALMSSPAFADVHQKRQVDSGAEFTSAADELISKYIPAGIISMLGPSITSAASAASVTGDSLLYSALLASSTPDWFKSAVPSEYAVQFASLEAGISQLRSGITEAAATATGGAPLVPVVIPVTTTDSDGKTVTSSFTTSGVPKTGSFTTTVTDSAGKTVTSLVAASASGASSKYSTFTDSAGSTITSAISQASSKYTTFTDSAGSTITSAVGAGVSGASSVGSKGVSGASSVGSVAVSGASSVGSAAVSGASSVGSQAVNGASSVVSDASSALAGPTSSSSSAGGAPVATNGALSGAAAGALGLVGLMIAL